MPPACRRWRVNFFEHQERARRQTRRMLLLFALAVAAIVAAVDLVVLLALGIDSAQRADGGIAWRGLFTISAFVALTIALGSLYRIASLRGGGAVVARALGGVPVGGDSGDFAYRRLRNVIEEIAIAAGVPAPQIFVLEDEAGINAFASGYAPTDAAVTVTRGALDKLTRAELQGVIGHEFSHILNGDMRLNIRLMGIVFGIVVVSVIGRKRIFRPRRQGLRRPGFLRPGPLRHRLCRRRFRARHQGFDLAPARIPRRRVGRAVHASDRRYRRRTEEDRRPCRRIQARQQRQGGSRPHAVRRRRRLRRGIRDAPAARRAHQAARSFVSRSRIHRHRRGVDAAGPAGCGGG